jgi:hypothetical protein
VTSLRELYPAALGSAVLSLAVTARQLGDTVAGAARDYLAPHAVMHEEPEMDFLLDLLTRPIDEVVSEADLPWVISQREWEAPAARTLAEACCKPRAAASSWLRPR